MTRKELVSQSISSKAKLKAEELCKIFLEEIRRIPDGERVDLCIQCGTCSGSCPTASLMDYSPREIIAALRAGLLDRVLMSNTVWLCTSCYYCTVRCPQRIKFPDIMYELKRLGSEYGYFPKKAKAPVMANIFINLVDELGRNHEGNLMMRYYLKTGLADAFRNAGRGFKLYTNGRISPRGSRIKGIDQLRKIREALAPFDVHKKKEAP